MANYVKISTIGAPTLPEKPGSNEEALEIMKAHWQNLLSEVLPDRPDVIVVPEACDRFSAHTHEERKVYYRFRGNMIRDLFADIAKKHRCYIAYSAAREVEDGTWRNSTQLIDRNGEILGIYNKNHLVIEETTEGEILCGKDAPIFECDFGRVALAICFDLNFDELRLKYKEAKPDLILFSSMYHGGLMQRYWAYSCRAHFVGSIARPWNCIRFPLSWAKCVHQEHHRTRSRCSGFSIIPEHLSRRVAAHLNGRFPYAGGIGRLYLGEFQTIIPNVRRRFTPMQASPKDISVAILR